MPRSFHLLRFIILSLGLHAVVLTALYLLPQEREAPAEATPVQIVRLPQEVLKRLPPAERPRPPERTPPHRGPVPAPRKFGTDEEITLPRTVPETGQGSGAGEAAAEKQAPVLPKGPLPFLTQDEIDELAKRGMPKRKPGDESVTLDTDELKLLSYNRWLKIKVESSLRYPELAAISGYQGVLYIRFDIARDGSLEHLELLKSSGYKILDDEALRSIRDSAPFQPLPDEWGMPRYSIRAAVIFYLNSAYVR